MSLRLELALREKKDSDGKPYLFAPIPWMNAVCFVFEEPARAGIRRAKLVLRPYDASRAEKTGAGVWEDDVDTVK